MAIPLAILASFIAGTVTYAALLALGESSALARVFWALLAAAAIQAPARYVWNRLSRDVESRPEREQRVAAAEGLALLRRGELAAARRSLEACVAREPLNAPALRALADIAFRQRDGEGYLRVTSRLLSLPDGLKPSERVALCHRQADLCLTLLNNPARAAEALVRIELDYPGTGDALRARQRIDAILSRHDRP